MKNKSFSCLFILLAVVSINHAKGNDITVFKNTACIQNDTLKIKESFNTEDLPVNEYLTERLKPVRANFKRINSINKWSAIKSYDLFDSTEGGEAKFYYQKGKLEKIITRNYGESGQLLTEYYLLNGKLSFVFEKDYKYNRPLFYDTKAMKENNDTEAFDFSKSEITENRSYFEKGHLVHIVNSQDCGAPFSGDYMAEEEKSILENFSNLLKLSSKKRQLTNK
ncbi:hypothetical protein [Elizabethkingia meningoseptica]|uniref:hypothetical protein n=1 Tax=Elizabethkingia meningoseptica TaxID=238 RepID=UPI003892644F